ncbi:MAG: hypothetical protein LBJ71_01435 [Holosporaceae bacterium]|jgi:hypothetical protein|nr:hypothetical protein [Holosporaceae bacterium]
MSIPWDMGLISALGKGLEYAIFPPDPPEEMKRAPYLIFELQNLTSGTNFATRVEFTLTIVDQKEVTSASFDIMKAIRKIIDGKLTLKQNEMALGEARLKIDSVEKKKNCLALKIIAIIKLNMVYEDE